MKWFRFNITDALKAKFPGQLKTNLESVYFIWGTDNELIETTILNEQGVREILVEESALSGHPKFSFNASPNQRLAEYITLDAFSWLNISSIFEPHFAALIAHEFESKEQ